MADQTSPTDVPVSDHFYYIYWFIVGICIFGAAISVYAVGIDSTRIDIVLTFWLSTAVSGGIGYLIGSSVKRSGPPSGNIEQADTVNVTSSTSAPIQGSGSTDTTK